MNDFQLKAAMEEFARCSRGMDDFGRDLIVRHAQSLLKHRPAPTPQLHVIEGFGRGKSKAVGKPPVLSVV